MTWKQTTTEYHNRPFYNFRAIHNMSIDDCRMLGRDYFHACMQHKQQAALEIRSLLLRVILFIVRVMSFHFLCSYFVTPTRTHTRAGPASQTWYVENTALAPCTLVRQQYVNYFAKKATFVKPHIHLYLLVPASSTLAIVCPSLSLGRLSRMAG